MASREITELPELTTVALDDYVLVRDITDGLDKKAQVGNLLASRIGGDTGSTDNAILRADGGGGKTLQAATNAIIDDDGQMALGSLSADGAMLNITCRAATVKGQKINAADSQTANLLEITKYGGTAGDLFVVNYKGDVGITVPGGNPNEPLHVQSDYDGNRAVRMQNDSDGTLAVARFIADTTGGSTFFTSYGANFTSSGSKRASSGSMIANATMLGGLSVVARHPTTGHVRLYSGGNGDANEHLIVMADGITRIGDILNSHYAQIAADGEITLNGNARVWKPWWVPANAIQAPQSRPATKIDHGLSTAWQFSDEAVQGNTKQIRATIGLPTDLDISEFPKLRVGWSSTTTSGNCYWQVEYVYRAEDEDTTAAAQETLLSAVACSSTAEGLKVSEFTLEKPISTDKCLHLRITRRSDDDLDTIDGDTVELSGLCLYYPSNRLGLAF